MCPKVFFFRTWNVIEYFITFLLQKWPGLGWNDNVSCAVYFFAFSANLFAEKEIVNLVSQSLAFKMYALTFLCPLFSVNAPICPHSAEWLTGMCATGHPSLHPEYAASLTFRNLVPSNLPELPYLSSTDIALLLRLNDALKVMHWKGHNEDDALQTDLMFSLCKRFNI